MITASHNPVADNGVKMVEPDGGMLPQAFEPVATELANCQTDDDVVAVLRDMVLGQAQQASGARRENLTVLVGHDTRPSAPQLLEAALAGIRALGVHAHSCGCVTTPQLHFLVYESNHGAAASSSEGPAAPPLQSYYDTILGAFLELASPTTSTTSTASTSESAPMVVYVDCANGVGAAQLKPVAEALAGRGIELRLRNTGAGGGQLNHRCGADFVQKDRLPPTEWEDVPDGARCCSVDGDADRLVYFSPQPPAEAAEAAEAKDGGSAAAARGIALWDGDKVAMLAAVFIRDLMAQLPAGLMDGVRVCCVQTAYANGASTAYLRDVLQLPTVCHAHGWVGAWAGVKYLHEAAHDADLGIYFESNGHGTVLFSKGLRERLQAAGEHPAAKELLLLSRLINQTVGDAISGLLLVELILRRKAWTLAEWQALYTDLPSRQLKLKVADRAAITTTDAERSCVTPPGLQAAIDEAVAKVPQGRAFARPSGTEDAVRIYAEAATQQEADELARTVAQLVYDKAGGVGPRP